MATVTLVVLLGLAIVVKLILLASLAPSPLTAAVYWVPYLSCVAASQVWPSGRIEPATSAPLASVTATVEPGFAAVRAISVEGGTSGAPLAGGEIVTAASLPVPPPLPAVSPAPCQEAGPPHALSAASPPTRAIVAISVRAVRAFVPMT